MPEQRNNAGFFIRFFAVLLDNLIQYVILLLPVFILARKLADTVLIDPIPALVTLVTYALVALFLGSVLLMAYFIYFTSKFGGSFGKILFGLKVLDQQSNSNIDLKTAFYRTFPGYGFSGALLGFGYFRILKNPQNLAWHDELFNTKVVRTNSYLPGVFSLILLSVVLVMLISSIASSLSMVATVLGM